MPLTTAAWLTPQTPRIICLPVSVDEITALPLTWPSLLSHTIPDTEILLLAMGTDFTALAIALPDTDRVKVAQTSERHDLWLAVLQTLPAAYAECDVILLRPGMGVPPGWDARLALSAYRQPGIAAAVPMCDSLPFLALLEPGKTGHVPLDQIDRLLLACSPRHDFESPLLFSGCVYLRRTALQAVHPWIMSQSAMSADAWCQGLAAMFREQGWCVVGCDHVYLLDHCAEQRQREMSASEDLEEVQLITRAHPLTGLRLAMRELIHQNSLLAPAIQLPTQLHIVHSWGGGLDYWVHQYCENDCARNNLVLRPIGTWGAFGQRIALYRSAVMDQPLRYWDLDYPIRATALAHVQYREILCEIITDFRIEAILISSLVGHSLDALMTGLPTVMIAHDYYPFCPAIIIQFGQVCDRCEPERLERCFAENDQNRFFRNVKTAEWLSLRRRFAQLAAAAPVRFVAPSPVVARHWQTLMPELCGLFTVIPHGLDFAPPRLPEPAAGERLRVIILGSLAPQKGRTLLEQLWPLIADRVDLYLVGCDGGGETVQGRPGMTIIPRYHRPELADLLTDIQPEVGLLLSVWPETFSYTLSELWLLGIPVVATDVGSFADRIQHGVNGFLCPPQAEAIADRLLAIAADRTALMPIRAWLTGFRHRSVAEMIADYHALIPLPEFGAARYFIRSALPEASVAARNASPGVVHIDVRAPFSEVLQEFGQYTRQKLMATPRLRAWQKRVLATLLHWVLHRAIALNRVLRQKS